MSPDERDLLERTLELAEENNTILRSLRRAQTWSMLWGFVKLAIVIIPFVLGYLYLEPYLGTLGTTLKKAQEVFHTLPN